MIEPILDQKTEDELIAACGLDREQDPAQVGEMLWHVEEAVELHRAYRWGHSRGPRMRALEEFESSVAALKVAAPNVFTPLAAEQAARTLADLDTVIDSARKGLAGWPWGAPPEERSGRPGDSYELQFVFNTLVWRFLIAFRFALVRHPEVFVEEVNAAHLARVLRHEIGAGKEAWGAFGAPGTRLPRFLHAALHTDDWDLTEPNWFKLRKGALDAVRDNAPELLGPLESNA